MITKVTEWAIVMFLAIAFVRFMNICMNRDNEDVLDRADDAEASVLKAIRDF